MRAAIRLPLSAASGAAAVQRVQRVLQLVSKPSGSPAALASSGMGQAVSRWLPGGGRGVAAAAAGSPRGKARPSQAMDRPASEDEDLWLICGLGNPGPRYESTRHNVGFMVVDALARQEAIAVDRLQENAAVGRGRFGGKKVLLVKPMTFMNVSGEAVGRLARFYRVPAERCLVVYDDLDLPTAQVRLRAKGGHGGHNGMKSISSHLGGSKDFPRIRVGIGRPPAGMPVPSYVLQDFSKKEAEEVEFAVQEAIDMVRSVLVLGLERAVSGVRVDRSGNVIKPPHPNGNGKQQQQQSGAKKEGQQPKAKKQRTGGEGESGSGAAADGQQQQQQQQQQQEQAPAEQQPVVAEAR